MAHSSKSTLPYAKVSELLHEEGVKTNNLSKDGALRATEELSQAVWEGRQEGFPAQKIKIEGENGFIKCGATARSLCWEMLHSMAPVLYMRPLASVRLKDSSSTEFVSIRTESYIDYV